MLHWNHCSGVRLGMRGSGCRLPQEEGTTPAPSHHSRLGPGEKCLSTGPADRARGEMHLPQLGQVQV